MEQPPDLDQHGRPVGAPPDLDASGKPVSAAAPVSALDMVSGRVGRDIGADTAAPDWKANLAGALEPMAHPQSAGDIAGLLLPTGGSAALGKVLRPVGNAVAKYGGAAAELGASLLPTKAKAALGVLKQLSPTEWNSPLTVAGREGRAVAASQRFNAQPLAEQMKSFPTSGPIPEGRVGMAPLQPQTPFNERPLYQQMQDLAEAPAPTPVRGQAPPIRNLGNEAPLPPPPGPSGPHLDRSMPMRPGEMTQQQIGERLKFGTGEPPPKVEKSPLGGRLPMSAEPLQPIGQQRPPITVSPESPMQEPRAQVGAEVIGRQNGMTTQQVRDTTGPIRGEAQGAAAGMPSKPMDRIVQKLIDMGPKGQGLPESAREGYAASATSDKARLQIQAYLDALRKVGFVGAGAAAPSLMRNKLVSGIQDQQ